MDLQTAVDTLTWRAAPADAIALAEKCAGQTADIRKAIEHLPTDGFIDLWLNHKEAEVLLNCGDWMEHTAAWRAALSPHVSTVTVDYEPSTNFLTNDPNWVKIAERPFAARAFLEKQAVSPTMQALSKATGFQGGWVPGAPNPLIGTLAGGLLGAGLGYGGGYLAEMMLPEKWKKDRLKRTAAILGGLAGAMPGAMWMMARHDQGKNPFATVPTPQPGSAQDYSNSSFQEMGDQFGAPFKAEGFDIDQYNLPPDPAFGFPAKEVQGSLKEAFNSGTGYNQAWPEIDVPEFHQTVWEDPRVANRLTPATRAASSGLLQGAAALSGGTRFVSPMDVARMTAGMGSGYLSGAVVGKALGLLTGMPTETQNRLKNTGMWAGIIANMIPIAFGR